jgi:hypothetical protein
MEGWKSWNDGKMEDWNDGMVEGWNWGQESTGQPAGGFSNIPVFHTSAIPRFRHSNVTISGFGGMT